MSGVKAPLTCIKGAFFGFAETEKKTTQNEMFPVKIVEYHEIIQGLAVIINGKIMVVQAVVHHMCQQVIRQHTQAPETLFHKITSSYKVLNYLFFAQQAAALIFTLTG